MRPTAFPLAAAAALAAALALAGCVSGPSAEPASAPAAEPPTVLRGEGMVTASGPMVAVGSQGFPFRVESNVTLLLAEIQWEDPVQDLDLALASPSAGMTGTAQNFDHVAEGGSPGAPDSPHGLTVEAPETGDWQASAFANGAGAAVSYRLAITLFHGEATVPGGYSALGS